MCGCSRNNNIQPGNLRQIVNNPSRNIASIAPIVPKQNQISPPARNVTSNAGPVSPERKRLERLQRDAIRKSLGK